MDTITYWSRELDYWIHYQARYSLRGERCMMVRTQIRLASTDLLDAMLAAGL